MRILILLSLISTHSYADSSVETKNSVLSEVRDNVILVGEDADFSALQTVEALGTVGVLDEDQSVIDDVVSGHGGNCPEEDSNQVDLSNANVDPATQLTDDGAYLREVVICALNEVHPSPPPAISRMRTLNFITNRVSENFGEYNITTNAEKANLLSQIIHETGGLTATIENRSGTSMWRDVRRGDSPIWDAEAYNAARANDDEYFNDSYSISKNSYKAAYRGRGLIQLTHCYNYVGFFLDRAARKQGVDEFVGFNDNFYYEDADGDMVHLNKKHCSQEDLQQISNYVKKEYDLDFDPSEIISDFENTVNQLAVPAPGQSVGNMSSQEFIVDSSFYYWRKCQNSYPDSVTSTNNHEFARLSGCIHGSMGNYLKSSNQQCPHHGSPWIREAFCGRKKYRDALQGCFDSVPKPEPADPKQVGPQ